MIWDTVSSWSVFADCIELLHLLTAKNIINLILELTIWWHPCVQSSLVLLEEGFAMASAFSWQNSVCLSSFCIPKLNLPITPNITWLSTFAFQSPMMKMTSLLVMTSPKWHLLVLEGLVSLHTTVQIQLLRHYLLEHRFGLPWYWMVCLGNERKSFCCLWGCTQVLHFRPFCWLWGLLHFF